MSAAPEQTELVPEDIHATVSELRNLVGKEIVGKFAIAEGSIERTRTGSAYAKVVLVDRTGRVDAKKWDCGTLPAEVGQVVGLRADVDEFNGTTQLKVKGWKRLPDEDTADYARASRFSREFLDAALTEELRLLHGPEGEVVQTLVGDYWTEFLAAPASKVYHHGYTRGLAEHTLSMLRLAEPVCRHYLDFYDDITPDLNLVRCGVWMHDFAKIADSYLDGVAWQETPASKLVGHIPRVCLWIDQVRRDLQMAEGSIDDLLHLVLSHHGKLEYGSPVLPKTAEAIVVHEIDMLDSHLAMLREATDGLEPGDWSSYCRPLGGEVRR